MLLGVDVGGTFTDAVLVDDDGKLWSAKSPSTPQAQQLGVVAAVEAVLARAGAQPAQVERFAHGMTVATNALLEGRGARTALVVTEGFTDIVELARQARASLYRLCEAGPRPLAPQELRFGAAERMGPDGPLRELDAEASETLVERVREARPEAVAVVLLHSYAHPQHERRLGELIAKRMPDVHVSLSHELVGTFREYERASTTEVDAALSPLLGSYLDELCTQTRARGLREPRIMQSSGGLTDAGRAASHAALTVLSGPAGGVGGALLLSEATGERDVLCFDMGGTSCDVCVIDGGSVAETAERVVAGRALALPALDIHTVGAGGGSIAWRDAGGALRVGPNSAGALPGPACYGLGGERPTVTDANLVLGRLLAEQSLAGTLSLDREAAERAVGALAEELDLGLLACAEGIVRVAEAETMGALAVMTVQRGIDPRRFALMPFGGAGPLHAAAIAERLGIERVLCPRACGVLCALGLAAAAPRRDVASTVMLAGETFTAKRLTSELARLAERAIADLGEAPRLLRVRYELRYRGQSFELGVECELDLAQLEEIGTRSSFEHDAGGESRLPFDPAQVKDAFERLHEERYGYRDERGEVELVNVRVSAIGAQPVLLLAGADFEEQRRESTVGGGSPYGTTQVVFDGEWQEAELWRGELLAGARIEGPALCALEQSTLLVPPGWHGTVDEHGTVLLEQRT